MNVQQVQDKPASPPAKTAAAPSRMSIKRVRKGIVDAPHRVLIYGAEKVGKSSFAAGAPSPVFITRDNGTDHLDVARFPQPHKWTEFLEALREVETGDHDFKSLVIDPANMFEPLCHAEIVGDSGDSIEAWNGGFGRGYDAALDRWRVVINAVERIWAKRRMNVIFVAHSTVKKFNDPEGPAYERHEIGMANKRVADELKRWVEVILFAKREAFGKYDDKARKFRAAGSGVRVAYTEWTPAYDAGNRWSLPSELPLGWREYEDAVRQGKERTPKLLAQIEDGLAELGDADVEKKVRAYLADKAPVEEVWNAVAAKLDEKRRQTSAGGTSTTNEGSEAETDQQEG